MDGSSLITLVLWFAALGLMMWRWSNGDRFHVPACLIGGGIWLLLPLLEPTMRSQQYAVVCVIFLAAALFRSSTEAGMARVQQTPRTGD